MPPRRAARTDANQRAIVEGLRAIPGVSVAVTSRAGDGFPDLVVGLTVVDWPEPVEVNFLLEIKDAAKPPSRRRKTDAQEKFADSWSGQYDVVESLEDALRVLGLE